VTRTAAERVLAADRAAQGAVVAPSAGLAALQLKPWRSAATSLYLRSVRSPLALFALAATLGCSSAPPLCIRAPVGRSLPRMAFPVGAEFRFAAGQLDILEECDREAPPAVRWSSSVPAVAAVDSQGLLRALAPGAAAVVVRAGGAEARFGLTVVAPVTRIEIRPGDTTLTVGDSTQFRAAAYDADGHPLPDALLAMRVMEDRASWLASGEAGLGLVEVFPRQPAGPRRDRNSLAVRARRAATGWVYAEVVGRRDSVRLRAAPP
jgi:hypothetical protein